MAYMALYRKWRPQSFKDLVGQDHISRTLSQAITTGRIGHAYLCAGPRGTGKTSTAKILAKALYYIAAVLPLLELAVGAALARHVLAVCGT